ncbi:hypothetical protein FIBSPDRAFT_106062 [Athelia psychrophila]|uniref:CCHC-type domain-containing protein n=1 Tax=Athelia psychrophila TaxID=1759441 RepID=A0A167SSA7_9AGAM|nr:hypothetical protein FIBSPDRAFT_106062 [Fibularhizoctonia sp. CBS 109695]
MHGRPFSAIASLGQVITVVVAPRYHNSRRPQHSQTIVFARYTGGEKKKLGSGKKREVFKIMAFPANKRGCFKCGNLGHIAENCTSDERLCYNCRQPGHESSACPSPRTVSAKQCYSCGGVGHLQSDCPTLRLQNASTGQKCFVRAPPAHIMHIGIDS